MPAIQVCFLEGWEGNTQPAASQVQRDGSPMPASELAARPPLQRRGARAQKVEQLHPILSPGDDPWCPQISLLQLSCEQGTPASLWWGAAGDSWEEGLGACRLAMPTWAFRRTASPVPGKCGAGLGEVG